MDSCSLKKPQESYWKVFLLGVVFCYINLWWQAQKAGTMSSFSVATLTLLHPPPNPGSLLYTLCFGITLQKFWVFLPPLKLVFKRVLWLIWKYLLQLKVAWVTVKSTPELWRCSREKGIICVVNISVPVELLLRMLYDKKRWSWKCLLITWLDACLVFQLCPTLNHKGI